MIWDVAFSRSELGSGGEVCERGVVAPGVFLGEGRVVWRKRETRGEHWRSASSLANQFTVSVGRVC
jgi:hypothetical protein